MQKDTTMQWRALTEADLDDIKALIYSILQEYNLQPEPDGIDKDLEAWTGEYDEDGSGCFWVLEDIESKKILGTVALGALNERQCELRRMFLPSSLRSQGLGRQAMTLALDKARALGFKQMLLETASVLKSAIRLYEYYGFRRVDKPNEVGRCDIVMALDLE